jgi:hypothetical protein
MAEAAVSGGTPEAGAPADGGAGAPPSGQPQQHPSGGGQQPVAGGQPKAEPEKVYTYKEDRTDWTPRTRLNEQKAKYERELEAAKAELEKERKRVLALSGVEPKSKEDAEIEEMREALQRIYPNLKVLDKLDENVIAELLETGSVARTAVQSQADAQASRMVGAFEKAVAEGLGAGELTPTQQRRLHSVYRDEARAALNARQTALERGERQTLDSVRGDNDFIARHERGDETLISELAKSVLDDFFVPGQRAAQASILRRQRPVPSGGRTRTQLTTKQPEIDYSDEAAFKKALIEARNERA